jgi:serine/threonine protein kinase
MSRDLSGKTLGGYRFGEVLARGAQSTVYAANQGESDRPVAVKVFLSELPKDKAAASRLVSDVQKVTATTHKNLVPVIEVGSLEWKGKRHLFIAMERLHGESLKSRLDSQPGHVLPLHVVLQLASTVGGALQAIHGAGFVHRGINPGAVFLSPPTDEERQADLEAEDHIYLLDLGAATFFEGLSSNGNGNGNGHAKRSKYFDDIRGLAALVSELLGGVPSTPVKGSEALLPLHFANRKIPTRIDAVLRSVLSDKLSHDKQDQYSSVAEFVAALMGDRGNLPTLAAWSGDGRATMPATRGKSPLLWAALMSVVGGLSFGVGYWLYLDPPPPTPAPAASTAPAPSAPVPDLASSDAANSVTSTNSGSGAGTGSVPGKSEVK